MMRKTLTTLLLVFVLIFSVTGVSSAANWQWITSTDDTTVSFDTTSIIDKSVKISNTEYINCIYSVWLKCEFTDAKGEALAKDVNVEKAIALELNEIEFDFKNRGKRIKSTHFYAKDGSLLVSMPIYMVKNSFDSIIPGSGGEIIFNATFKEYQAQYGKK